MDLTKISSSEFKAILKLLKSKEKIQKALSKIESKLQSLGSGSVVAKSAKAKAPRKARKARRPKQVQAVKAAKVSKRKKQGNVKATVLAVLAKAAKGLHIKEISKATGIPVPNVNSFIFTGGKKLLKKVAPATYALVAAPVAEKPKK